MTSHYVKVAWRSLLRSKEYAISSVAGLSLGLASCVIIALFVMDELSFDQYHVNKNNIYRLATKVKGGDFEGIAKVNGPWGPTAFREVPEVVSMTRFVFPGQLLMENGDRRFYEAEGAYCDSTVFDIFSFNVIQGNSHKALTEPNSIAISEKLAAKYFPGKDALGELLKIDGQREFRVTAIFADIPANSHFTFEYLLSMASLEHPQRMSWKEWNQFYTYLLLDKNANPDVAAGKITTAIHQNMDAETAARFTPLLQPLTRIHLYSHLHREIQTNSSISYVYIFSSIAILILFIACTNFINMMTARSTLRGREVGVRKVNGALRRQLFSQFMIEVSIMCIAAAVIALMLAGFALPVVNDITMKHIAGKTLFQPIMISCIVGITVVTALLAGTYPALYQSALKPIKALKGASNTTKGLGVRKGLVTIQFALSLALVIGSVIIMRQMDFVQRTPLGFDATQVITVAIRDEVFRKNYEAVRTELLKNPAILSVSLSGNLPGGSDWGIPSLPEGFTADNVPPIRILAVDETFVPTYGLKVVAGRNFSAETKSDTATYLINEECARQLGWTDPLSKTISMPAVNRPPAQVIGIVKDFHFHSLREKISPLIFIKPPTAWFSIYSINIDATKTAEALQYLESQWTRFDPAHPFDYNFFDANYSNLYQQERRLSQVVTYFTAIGIFLACLGLYSLISYTTEIRRKELSIRKVVGATAFQLTAMLAWQSLTLVLIGFLLAAPVSAYILLGWLQSFAYHVDVTFGLLAGTGLVSILIAFLTIASKTYKAASINPVHWLRNE